PRRRSSGRTARSSHLATSRSRSPSLRSRRNPMRPGEMILKDPDAETVYAWDWSDWLGSATVLSHEILIVGPDMALEYDHDSIVDGTTVRARLKGGTLGRTYTVTCRITTNEAPSQTDDRSVLVAIRDR